VIILRDPGEIRIHERNSGGAAVGHVALQIGYRRLVYLDTSRLLRCLGRQDTDSRAYRDNERDRRSAGMCSANEI
jgi:hypothetical protein